MVESLRLFFAKECLVVVLSVVIVTVAGVVLLLGKIARPAMNYTLLT